MAKFKVLATTHTRTSQPMEQRNTITFLSLAVDNILAFLFMRKLYVSTTSVWEPKAENNTNKMDIKWIASLINEEGD